MSDNSNYQVLSSNPSDLVPQQADNDEQLINLWLHGRSKHTQRAYRNDIQGFFAYVNQPLKSVKLQFLQDYADYLLTQSLSLNSVRRTLASIKSLFAYAHKIGYLPYDVGKPLIIPKGKNKLAERILSEEEVHKLIDSIENQRNQLIIKTLYFTGLRISELVSLKWKDISETSNGAILNVMGKGDKTNTILLPIHLYEDLIKYRGIKLDDYPIFESQKGGHLNPDYISKMLKIIAVKVLGKNATPHWLRHSHASHALENGCPIHLVQKQLNHSSIATTGRYLHARPTESSSKYLK